MRSFWSERGLRFLPAVLVLITAPSTVLGQARGGTSGTTGAASSGTPSTGTNRGTTGTLPGTSFPNSSGTTNPNQIQRPIFLSGKVIFDDGSPANPDIRIERVCGGTPRLESHTDSKGRFSFQVGQNAAFDTDAADSAGTGRFGRSSGAPSGFGSTNSGMSGTNPLWNCELRASYPGYRSDMVELGMHRSLDDPDLGTIVLHRLVNVKGTTISVTSSLAPKQAQKDYEKGLSLAQKGKFEDAEKHLLDATELYEKYAVAWFSLGEVQQRLGKNDDARRDYENAIKADNKYVSPYNQLALLSAQSGKWQEVADYSRQVISLNPVEFPNAFWFNAVANYNLNHDAEAEKSAKELLKVDSAHKYPEAESMMGQLLYKKGEYADAANHFRAFLTLQPNAKNADSIKQALARIDQATAEAKK